MAGGKKYYTVWRGRECGVFDNWADCKAQVDQYEGARYKGFESKAAAEKAFLEGYGVFYKNNPALRKSAAPAPGNAASGPILNSLSVDAAWNSVTKVMEYQGVYTATKELIFRKGPFAGASNNIGEFLALVHGLALLQKQGSHIPIYSDSITAIAWVREKRHKSVVLPTDANAEIFELLQRAEFWLRNNTFNNPILKWQTKVWGEIPADFGRK